MSKRPGILVTKRFAHPSPPPPNNCKPEISVEIRAHWPPNARADVLADALFRAWWEALNEIARAQAVGRLAP